MKKTRIVAAVIGGLALAAGLARAPEAQHDPVYEVRDGKVDANTYNGYRRYGDACLRCHGQGAIGSSFAPSLVDSLKRLSYEEFTEVVINGRQNLGGGQEKVMPAFGENQDVATYIDDIYGYVKARSDDKIPATRPQKF